ncbi:IS66 family insertion sequence element accessory protein TnpA [Paenibacillus xylanexedens]|uniref:IS66 family insertion sequence element accessory protein TnpA n=1 Tax=Paenibacillus xylanexedens TaxID=528191 RepID=UPI003B015209
MVRIQEFRQSGLTMKAWCQKHGFTFYQFKILDETTQRCCRCCSFRRDRKRG